MFVKWLVRHATLSLIYSISVLHHFTEIFLSILSFSEFTLWNLEVMKRIEGKLLIKFFVFCGIFVISVTQRLCSDGPPTTKVGH